MEEVSGYDPMDVSQNVQTGWQNSVHAGEREIACMLLQIFFGGNNDKPQCVVVIRGTMPLVVSRERPS